MVSLWPVPESTKNNVQPFIKDKLCVQAAASIRFEIWGVVDPGKKNRFSRKISEKFRFF